jgi:hypothetical protein
MQVDWLVVVTKVVEWVDLAQDEIEYLGNHLSYLLQAFKPSGAV